MGIADDDDDHWLAQPLEMVCDEASQTRQNV